MVRLRDGASRRRQPVEVPVEGPTHRVVVVDDDVVVGMTLTFARPGLEVIDASRRAEGLSRIREEQPDAVIVDRRFPDGDGLALVRALRTEPSTSGLPIVVLTASHDEADRSAVEAAGADAYVAKPFDPDELVALLDRLIEDRPERRPAPRRRAKKGAEIDLVDAERPIFPGRSASTSGRVPRQTPLKATRAAEQVEPAPAVAPEAMPETRAASTDELLAQARADNARLSHMVAALEADLDHARALGTDEAHVVTEVAPTSEPLQQELAEARAEIRRLEDELATMRAVADEVDQLRRELSQAHAEIEAHERRSRPGAARSTQQRARRAAASASDGTAAVRRKSSQRRSD